MFEKNSDNKNPLKLQLEKMTFSSPREALGATAFLAAMDRRYLSRHFTRTVNSLHASIAHGKLLAYSNPLTIQGKKIDHPFIIVSWVSVNEITAAVLDNGIRDCYAGEANGGDNHFITNVISPFVNLEEHSEYLELIVREIKQITHSDSIFFLDQG